VKLSALLPPLFAIFWTGCAVSASRLTEIHAGMSREQVAAILGKPFAAESKDGVESLYFNLGRFREAAFGGIMRPLNIGKKHFRVDLVDGKVLNYYQSGEQ
jgi:outer membrane protein assembly factor BamE (lipoprotein component of BamABCDE complex)